MAGLIIPPAVVPTIFLLQQLGLYKTLFGMILVEVAFALPFATMVLRAFVASIPREIDESALVASIPREIDESALIDGASPLRLFFSIILPLLWPAIVTVIVVQAVAIYNDFAGPFYFLPGTQNVTAQLTLFNFISQFNSSFNLLFANVVVITIPPLVMFLFFQRHIVAGRLPVTALKIDMSFVGGHLAHDRRDLAIVRSTVEPGHNLGLKVVAEGVGDELTLGFVSCLATRDRTALPQVA